MPLMTTVKTAGANALALGRGVKGLAFVIVALGVLFGDVAFIWMFWNVFPPGIFRIACVLGAFTTTLSVIGLFIGKQRWFRPGAQLVWAWVFAGIELTIAIVNTIAAFSIARGDASTFAYWVTFVAPATPFIALIGWFLITWFDEDRKREHKRMEAEDALHDAELEYELAAKMAAIRIKQSHLEHGERYLKEEIDSDHMQRQIHDHSAAMLSDVLSTTTGYHFTPQRFIESGHEPVNSQNGHNGHKPAKNA